MKNAAVWMIWVTKKVRKEWNQLKMISNGWAKELSIISVKNAIYIQDLSDINIQSSFLKLEKVDVVNGQTHSLLFV